MGKSYSSHLLISDWNLLNDWCKLIRTDFNDDSYGPFLVGSVLSRPDFRDVDVRLIMPDDKFDLLFPDAVHYPYPRGRLAHANTAYSLYAQKVTGLPVDFQFQRMTEANKDYSPPKHKRNAIGMKL